MTTYFSADSHFGDRRARTFYRRPFASVEETMIDRWNSVVQPGDETRHLGDFAIRQPFHRADTLLQVLHGRKRLLVGNNDDAAVTGATGWLSVQPYAELFVDTIRLVLCHYPFRTWRDMCRGAINLHGHSHGQLKPMPRQFDVGVDVWHFRPVKLADILAKAKSRRV